MNRKSPYTATITGCAFLFNEFQRVLPLFMSDQAAELVKEEIQQNNLLHVNSLKARQTFMNEFKRRYAAAPPAFWQEYIQMSEAGRKAGLLYAILKAYKLAFDFHFNVTVKRWYSVDRILTKNDLMMEFIEIGMWDSFVDGWTEKTKRKCVSQYLTILRQAGLLDEATGELKALHLDDPQEYAYYLRSGEEWFLEACLLYTYEIHELKYLRL